MTTMPLSLILMGSDPHLQRRLQDWTQLGAVTLLGIWDPHSPAWEKWTLDTERSVDLILAAKEKKEYLDKIQEFQQDHTLVLDIHTFWILELLIEKTLDLTALSKSEQLFQTISKYSHEGIQFVDAEGIVQYVNPSFSRITNVLPEERIGKSIFDVSPKDKERPHLPRVRRRYTVLAIARPAPVWASHQAYRGAVLRKHAIFEHFSMQEALSPHIGRSLS